MYKNLFINKKAVTFDLDDTLVKTSPLWDAAFSSVCEGLGIIWPGFAGNAGVRLEVIWDNLISSNSNDKINLSVAELVSKTEQKFLQLVSETDIEETVGFWELAYELKEEKKYKLALVSNSQRKIVDAILSKLGISKTFDVTVCGDEVKKPKPHPEMYLKAAKLLGVNPKTMVAFEDSPTGAQSAVSAGCTTIVVYDATFFESDYPKQIATMISGFDDVVGKMDLTYKEYLQKATEAVSQQQTQES
jgi:HAD superfamily hydrolase (TIGR01509 family)